MILSTIIRQFTSQISWALPIVVELFLAELGLSTPIINPASRTSTKSIKRSGSYPLKKSTCNTGYMPKIKSSTYIKIRRQGLFSQAAGYSSST